MRYLKGQADIIYLIVVLFVVIIALFAVDSIWSAFQTNPTSQQLFNATPQGQHAEVSATSAINTLNNAVVVIFIIAAIASVIAAAFTESSLVFMVPAIIVLPIEVFFSFIFHDAFFSIVSSSSLGTVAVSYPILITLMQYLPLVALGIAVAEIIIIFLK